MVKVLSGSSQPRSLAQFIRGTGLYINKPARIHLPRRLDPLSSFHLYFNLRREIWVSLGHYNYRAQVPGPKDVRVTSPAFTL